MGSNVKNVIISPEGKDRSKCKRREYTAQFSMHRLSELMFSF